MDNIENVYDLLNNDAVFAQQVSDIHRGAASVQRTVSDFKDIVEEQKRLAEKANRMMDLISRLEGELMSLREERDALQKEIKQQETTLEEMQRLEESFNGAMNAYKNINSVYEIFDSRVRKLEEKQGMSAQTIEQEPPKHADIKKFVPFKEVDYDEITSVEKLFTKYNGKINGPVIVVRKKTFPWNGDYCMAIKAVNNGKAWGTRYNYGKPSKKTPIKANDEEYSMYCGERYWEIAEDFQNRQD